MMIYPNIGLIQVESLDNILPTDDYPSYTFAKTKRKKKKRRSSKQPFRFSKYINQTYYLRSCVVLFSATHLRLTPPQTFGDFQHGNVATFPPQAVHMKGDYQGTIQQLTKPL